MVKDTVIEKQIAVENGHKVIYETRVDKRGKTYHVKFVFGDENLMDIAEKIIRNHFMSDLVL